MDAAITDLGLGLIEVNDSTEKGRAGVYYWVIIALFAIYCLDSDIQ